MEIERKNRIRYTHVANWNVYLLFENRECWFSKSCDSVATFGRAGAMKGQKIILKNLAKKSTIQLYEEGNKND